MKTAKLNLLMALFLSIIILLPVFNNICCADDKSLKEKITIPDSTHLQILKLKDGSTFVGRITDIREEEIDFNCSFGTITLYIDFIEKIKEAPVTAIKNGKYWFPNPNATRLLFAPTARMLNKGEGYFADYYVLFPTVVLGITDNFTLGGGVSLIPGMNLFRQLFYLTPKFGISASPEFQLAAGALIVNYNGEGDEDGSFTTGIIYGVGTAGNIDNSFTFGLGYGFINGELAKKPMLMFGGETRVARTISLVSENWVFPGLDYPLISYGIRFMGESHSIDFAFIYPLNSELFLPGIPYLDFVLNF